MTPAPVARITACDCLTAFGDAPATHQALLEGRIALEPTPVLGSRGGDAVPLALLPDRVLDEDLPPRWLDFAERLLSKLPGDGWGSPRRPVIVTSSNFGVGSLYAYRLNGDARNLAYGTPFASVEQLAKRLDWRPNTITFSHACVTAHLGLLHASRLVDARLAEKVLVLSFDLLSPFVTGGFHALKILNGMMPAPYEARDVGSIGLGDGLAFAVVEPASAAGEFSLLAQAVYNEMHHFTANRADGAGFAACIREITSATAGRRVWLKGHGTGTLEAGKLEAGELAAAFPESPLVSWKGSLGHTLGSCGLVELALTLCALRNGRAPGTPGSRTPTFTSNIMLEPFSVSNFDAAVCTSNAFGGAHAALLVGAA